MVHIEPWRRCAVNHHRHCGDRIGGGLPCTIPPQDGPRTMDCWRQGIWLGAGLVVNGRRDLHHLHISRGEWLGVLPGWTCLVYSRVRAVGLCNFVLYPPADL